jgi:hypothetical protein
MVATVSTGDGSLALAAFLVEEQLAIKTQKPEIESSVMSFFIKRMVVVMS